MDKNIISDLRASAKNSEQLGWITHARMDNRAADELERLVKYLALIERNADDIGIVRIAREALGLDATVPQ